MTNINPFIQKVIHSIEAHKADPPGGYRQKLSSPPAADLYGTADAIILLYTLGQLPTAGCHEYRALVNSLQSFQQSESGLFPGIGHHPVHGTAYALSALELLDSKPLYPLTALHPTKSRTGLEAWMEGLDWAHQPWGESHKGAGIYAAMVLAGEVDNEWEQWYFEWLHQETDPETGFWRKGAIQGGAPLFHHLASSFHYLFNLSYRKQPMRYPNQWIDTCLTLQAGNQIPLVSGELSFVELDVLYTLLIAAEQTRHRETELRSMIRTICTHLLSNIETLSSGPEDELFEDLHPLCGTVCALALVQSAMPEQITSDRVLLKILDRRPFI
ncbi:hypothetical protein [Paenibacillus albus]|uniref:Prenyltransferase n=1 Tax=Paenibacillus albus TaxID=2495582 RepID=A0A3S9A7I4_9BACL|nr:hypothetical protein [Paenibacillus albus]AZN41671.1 hypothetical protein EJC50_19810 [Paenibacillus albus]